MAIQGIPLYPSNYAIMASSPIPYFTQSGLQPYPYSKLGQQINTAVSPSPSKPKPPFPKIPLEKGFLCGAAVGAAFFLVFQCLSWGLILALKNRMALKQIPKFSIARTSLYFTLKCASSGVLGGLLANYLNKK